MTTTREALERRGLDDDLIDTIMENNLSIKKLKEMTIELLRENFNEKETVKIWEKISIPFRERNRYDEKYQKLKEFVQNDGKSLEEKREIYLSFDRCLEEISSLEEGENRILIFVGNGINEVRRYNPELTQVEIEDNSLSTKYLALNYVRDMGDSKPREFQERKESLKKIHQILSQEYDKYDMLDFMKHFSEMTRLKEGFLEHIIKTCAQASPNSNHNALLLFILLLRILNSKNQMVLFTTNYDNLLEKAYLDYNNKISDIGRRYFPSHIFTYDEAQKYQHTLKTLEGLIIEPRKTTRGKRRVITKHIMSSELRPKFVMSSSQIDKHLIPIVPIHGSIRVCKCENCNRELETEATAISKKRCVYCGSELSTIVLPTAEGETDKDLLKILEKEVKRSNIIFFIGYGMDDPHIREKVNSGLEGQKNKTIVNICDKKIDTDYIKKNGHKLIDVNYYIDISLEKIGMNLVNYLDLSEHVFTYFLYPTYRRGRMAFYG